MIKQLNPSSIQSSEELGLSSGSDAGSLVFANAMAIDASTMKLDPRAATLEDEVRIVFEQLDAILGEAGLTRADIVKTTCYLSRNEDRFDFIAAYKEQLGQRPYPARCTFVVGLAADARVQIEAVAARPIRG